MFHFIAMVPTCTIAFSFLTLNSAPTTNVYVLYKYSCLDIGPICFIVSSRSIAGVFSVKSHLVLHE